MKETVGVVHTHTHTHTHTIMFTKKEIAGRKLPFIRYTKKGQSNRKVTMSFFSM